MVEALGAGVIALYSKHYILDRLGKLGAGFPHKPDRAIRIYLDSPILAHLCNHLRRTS